MNLKSLDNMEVFCMQCKQRKTPTVITYYLLSNIHDIYIFIVIYLYLKMR